VEVYAVTQELGPVGGRAGHFSEMPSYPPNLCPLLRQAELLAASPHSDTLAGLKNDFTTKLIAYGPHGHVDNIHELQIRHTIQFVCAAADKRTYEENTFL
jgi:hypothetical protein